MEVKKYDKIILDSSRSIDDIVAGIKAELSKKESENSGESYICYVSHAYSSGENAGVSYIVVSDGFKELKRLSSNVIKASAYSKDEINELIATKAHANSVVNLTGEQTIEGVKTFSAVPVVASQPTDDNQVANKAYVDSKVSTVDISKASWGVNWNAPIMLGSFSTLEIPNDGVIFLWGGDEFTNLVTGERITAFQFIPKNYTGKSGENIEGYETPQMPQFARFFSKSVQDGRETIGQDHNNNAFFLYGRTTDDLSTSALVGNYPLTTTLSFFPVRQGDKVFLKPIKDGITNLLNGIFFPFER